MRKLLTLVVLAVILACRPVTAQNVGDRVRVTTAVDTVMGNISATSEHGLLLELEDRDSREFVAYAEIQRLEIHKEGLLNEGIGLLLGVALGSGVGEATARELPRPPSGRQGFFDGIGCILSCDQVEPEREWTTVGYIAVVAGAGVGYLLGRELKSEEWDEVPLPADSLETEERLRGKANRLVFNPMVDAQRGLDGSLGVILGMRVRF